MVECHLAKVDVAGPNPVYRSTCGCSSMVELQPSKLVTWVRFPSPAPARRAPALTKTLSSHDWRGFSYGFLFILFLHKAITLPKAEVSRLRARPKGFPIALWKPSGPSLCCYTVNAAQYYRRCRATHSCSPLVQSPEPGRTPVFQAYHTVLA